MKWTFQSDDAEAAYRVRDDLLSYLTARASDDSDLAAAVLIFAELVGNVVRHAPGPIAVDLYWADEHAILRVRDHGPGFEWLSDGPHVPDLFAESGRGLFIVATTARKVHVRRHPERGTEATAYLPIRLRAPLA